MRLAFALRRMHPHISKFPREIFYKNNLFDGENVLKRTYAAELQGVLALGCPDLKPFTIINLNSSEERRGVSLSNSDEANLCLHLVKTLTGGKLGNMDFRSRIGIIAPYAEQVSLLRRTFSSKNSNNSDIETVSIKKQFDVEINSVDGFQGREKDIIIFSAVRAGSEGSGIGFLADVRRMNVALTRAKKMMIIICDCERISVNELWRELINRAKEQHVILDAGSNTQFDFTAGQGLTNVE